MPEEIRITPVASIQDKIAVMAMRLRVFGEEQGIDPTLDFDGNDATFPLFIGKVAGRPAATIRLRQLDQKTAKIERLVVDKPYRGHHYGKAMMLHLMQHVQAEGYQKAMITAQAYLRRFYEDLGYQAEGEEFKEAGLPHIKMTKILN